MRLSNVVQAFSQVGAVELFALVHEGQEAHAPPSLNGWVERTGTAVRPNVALSPRMRLAWHLTGRVPLELFGRDYGAAREVFLAWRGSPYDLVWFGDAETYVAFGDLARGPAIVDFDDLEDQTAWLKGTEPVSGAVSAARSGFERVAGLERQRRRQKNGELWTNLRMRVSQTATALAVCSELDRERCALPGAVVVPNGYPAPGRPLGRVDVGLPPTVLLAGYLRYGPNIDAARRLVNEVGPVLRKSVPDAQIRLVGLGDVRSRVLHAPPSVVVTGPVIDMAPELATADLVAVPLRHAGGTRIKILEAFAHRIPVVSTRVGAEGLDVRDGEHLLVRDDPADFAAACVSLLEDRGLRNSLTNAAATLFETQYRSDDIQRRIAALGIALLADREWVVERGGWT